MKYFANTIFNGTSISTANTSGTSDQFDISEAVTVWLQYSATGTSSTTDISIQFQVSNDSINKAAVDSVWLNQDSASTYNTSNFFRKHIVGAMKGRVSVTRNSGAAVFSATYVAKPVATYQDSGTNSGDVTFADFGSTANSAGASISGQVITLQPASATQPGGVTTGTQSFAGVKTFSTQMIGKGTTAADNAAVGYIGEAVTSGAVGLSNAAATTHYGDLTSISLTPGDWDVSFTCEFFQNSAVVTKAFFGISVNSGDDATGLVSGDNFFPLAVSSTFAQASSCIAQYRKSLTATTTVWAKMYAEFSAGTPQYRGRLTARRAR